MKFKFVRVKRLPDWPAWAVVVVLLWLALVSAAVYLSTKTGKYVDLCLFRRITRIPCPTCGSTRSVLSIFEGNFFQAFMFNPLLFITGFIFSIIFGARILFAKKINMSFSKIEMKFVWIALVFLLLVNWVYVIASVG